MTFFLPFATFLGLFRRIFGDFFGTILDFFGDLTFWGLFLGLSWDFFLTFL